MAISATGLPGSSPGSAGAAALGVGLGDDGVLAAETGVATGVAAFVVGALRTDGWAVADAVADAEAVGALVVARGFCLATATGLVGGLTPGPEADPEMLT